MQSPPVEQSEFVEQVAVFEWAALHEWRWPCLALLFGSIMGVHLPPKYLNKCLKAGMKKGKPDINMPFPMGGYIGLWIELKKSDGKKPRKEQERYLRMLAAAGNATFACRGSRPAIRVITAYLENKICRPNPLCPPGDPAAKLILQENRWNRQK